MAKQRVRDPLHDLIAFDTDQQLERTLWMTICSKPFQRLRRVRQLGFSELVYPGATHTRFAHSIGVFHTARELMQIVRQRGDGKRLEARENIALAAALVHDVGHGPFSHAFEAVGKELELELADHEKMSDLLIREGELAEILKDMGSGFANDVADMVKGEEAQTVHNAVVSSQFDADRLDYMRRDRLMAGVRHSSIDFTWLLENLEIANVPYGLDEEKVGDRPTFVIGPKAIHAAEAYVLGLFQLYPTVYFHKATRGAEKLFVELFVHLVRLIRDSSHKKVGLAANHPLVEFAKAPEDIESALKLDDTVVWGSLSLLREAEDPLIKTFAERLQDRKLFKCIDIRAMVHHKIDPKNDGLSSLIQEVNTCCAKVLLELGNLKEQERGKDDIPIILTDQENRSPYKTVSESHGPLEQINVRTEGGSLIDLEQRSEVVAGLREFKLTRAYFDREIPEIESKIHDIVEREVKACHK
ncbi:MAG: HD domain-containing protein [Boseongicola sp. SB0677_bin_26]|nr:HD domain-containing protein [Boseongicola sp. SB0665_bin_10]MYG26184.1 HD domain-containing protein [Boseongicola sp. SB0677_bin_26]